MRHPHRHSSFFISSNVSFYIPFSKIPIKCSVKYLATQISFLPFSFTFHFYLIHQFPSFSVFPFLYQINHNHHTSSRKFIFRIELYKRLTDRHRRSPALSTSDPSHPDISIKHPRHTLIRLGTSQHPSEHLGDASAPLRFTFVFAL